METAGQLGLGLELGCVRTYAGCYVYGYNWIVYLADLPYDFNYQWRWQQMLC